MLNDTAPRQLRLDQQIEARTVTVTPQLAEEWLGRNESNRNLRQHKVAEYARDMAAGHWRFTGEAIRFDADGRLIDGQHRLNACIAADVSFTTLVIRGLAPGVRTVIDTGVKRSPGDALKIAGLGSDRTHRVAAIVRLALMFEGEQEVRAGVRAASPTNSEVGDFYGRHAELLEYCAQIATRHSRALNARPAAIGAAMFVAANAGHLDRFVNFIVATADLNFNGTGDPKATLFKRLAALRNERHNSTEEMYYLLRAFQAETAGRRMAQMKSSTGNGRSVIPTTFKEVAA